MNNGSSVAIEPVVLDSWHVVALANTLGARQRARKTLLGHELQLSRTADGDVVAKDSGGNRLPVLQKYGCIWTSLGSPSAALFSLPMLSEPDRRTIHVGGLGVHVSAPRAIENFLDLGHLPFVHRGTLGIEPYTEVSPYVVELRLDGILATRCRMFQPKAALSATEGFFVDYSYHVVHPYAVILEKANAIDPMRMDVIGLFVQPVEEERIVAFTFVSVIDRTSSDAELLSFQQRILAQDRPILENQRPKRLPLNLRVETPVRADASSIAYRRWLRELGYTYGTIA